ncbi:MAG: GNAT family N-acetyltransferase, partial [Christensenellales bacterium]
MPTILRPLERADLAEATRIWNQVVEEGDSFPGDEPLSQEEAWQMFREQTLSVCAVKDGSVAGLYILHPNGIGRL